ncbi:hypothetical protein E1B28_003089 [Marasmius oreades]|uniref:F-box domain-containing protein n=1 Tax=Marasmius oreades TaxID=181124 RepID=A0A9P7RL54_9AGAR|nr:uncharacterized protein E1B28_003089 [Marasmius oreades]KAG7085530.1 hypothetical protein E1B28_003089 [Marasmius oreades]
MPRKSSRIEEKQKLKEATAKVAVPPIKGKATKKTSKTKAVKKHGNSRKSTSTNKRSRTSVVEPKKLPNPKQRGYLEHFAKQAPLDVMLEIFSYLWPREILFLSRTSKALRHILMSKSSALIWRAARNNAGLPPLPPDLSEPQYASLAFDPYCHACGRGPCDSIFWKIRVKCHKKCIETMFYPLSRLPSVVKGWSEVEAMIKLGMREGFLPRLEGWAAFLPSVIESFYAQYKVVKGDAGSLKEWSSAKKREYISIAKHSELCERWQLQRIEDRKTELDELRLQRANVIIGRLSEDGWDIGDLRALEHLHYYSIYKPVAFDEETWPGIYAHLTEALVRVKDDRLKREEKEVFAKNHRLLRRVFDSFRKQDTRFNVIPIGDVVLASAKLNGLLWRLPCDKELEVEFTNVLSDELPGIAQAWTDRVEQDLISVLQKEVPDAKIGTLSSVCSVFQCRRCLEPLWYPFILGHHCFRRGGVEGQHLETKLTHTCISQSKWHNIFDPFRETNPWDLWYMDSTRILYSSSTNFSKRMKSILSLCGFNPESTSMDEMLKADPLLKCSECRLRYSYYKEETIGWTIAVYHCNHGSSQLSMVDQSNPDMQAFVLRNALSEEARIIRMRTYNGVRTDYFSFFCKLCRGGSEQYDFISYGSLKAHMKARHEITDEDTINKNWEVNPASGLGLHSHRMPFVQ